MQCNKAGRFFGTVTEVRARKSDSSQSVMLYVKTKFSHIWNVAAKNWQELAEPEEAEGGVCLINKAGEVQEKNIETICGVLGWDGDTDTIGQYDWTGVQIQGLTKRDDYNGKVRYIVDRFFKGDANADTAVNLPDSLKLRMKAIAQRVGAPAPPTVAPVAASEPVSDDKIPF